MTERQRNTNTTAEANSSKKYYFFWKSNSPLSQWFPSHYELDGVAYSTAEQGMMHGKALLFGDTAAAEKILQTRDPRRIKALGRTVKGFSEQVWRQNREAIVYRNNVAKFQQNRLLMQALLEIDPGTLLVEASPYDRVWGIGLSEKNAKNIPESKWKGLNLLGKMLTRVRDELAAKQQEELENAEQEETGSNSEPGTKANGFCVPFSET